MFIFYALLPYVCLPFLHWVRLCRGYFRQVFVKKWSLVSLGKWSSYKITIVWEFAWVDSVLVILDEWSSYKGGCLNSFDCIIKLALSCFILLVAAENSCC